MTGNLTSDEQSPNVTGPSDSPVPTLADRQAAWRELYIGRMISAGVDEQDAEANFEACGFGPGGFDIDEDPEGCADDEMSYWEAE